MFEALGDILMVMTSLDHVIGQSEAFKQGWAMYKRCVWASLCAVSV